MTSMLCNHYSGFPPLHRKANKVLQVGRVLAFYRIAPCLSKRRISGHSRPQSASEFIYVTSRAKTFRMVAVRTLNGTASERLGKPFETGNVNG